MTRAQTTRISLLTAGLLTTCAFAGSDQWVDFEDQTNSRLVSDPSRTNVATDNEEKDYAWGDVDNDGDIDVIVARKQPFTSSGKRVNMLLMNEGIAEGHSVNGVLVDRTMDYAIASDALNDNGFDTATNDRDIFLTDVDLDGWLDIVTAPTLSDNNPAHLKLPRVYMNLGLDGDDNWLGFRYEEARVQDFTPGSSPNSAPRFCSVAAGDLTGDGYPDLYFGDYDSGGSQQFDYNNRVLVNDGNGFFTDETTTVLPTSQMRSSAFGAASVIIDMNLDGVMDVIKQTSLASPTHVAVTYNNPNNEGVMMAYDLVDTGATYFASAGDLNNDGLPDIVVTDDGADKYHLNTGNGADGLANFSQHVFHLENGGSESAFGGNSWVADLDHDGWNDVIITNVDVDIPNCNSDRMHIYRNLGGTVGGFVDLREQGQVIPFNQSGDVHDVAVFDLNGDSYLDMVVGRCSGTDIYIQNPPVGLQFAYPNGRPAFVQPGTPTTVEVDLSVIGAGVIDQESIEAFASVDGGKFVPLLVTQHDDNSYSFDLPSVDCASTINYYVQGELEGGLEFNDPPNAPATTYLAIAAVDFETVAANDMEGSVDDWTVENVGELPFGAWELAEPNGTVQDTNLAAPSEDNTEGGVMAFVTENDPSGNPNPTGFDVDNGITHLISPTIDLAGTDATVSYARWFYSASANPLNNDTLRTEISNDNGDTWVLVNETSWTTNGQQTEWDLDSFLVSDFVEPTNLVRVRFTTSDLPNNSVTEAGIDDFAVEAFVCDAPCLGDVSGDGTVDTVDLLQMLGAWGVCDGCSEDLSGDGLVDTVDLLQLLGVWGDCE